MLSIEKIREYSPDVTKYPPKFFACLYYCHKIALDTWRQEQALICLKQILSGGPGKTLFLRACIPGEEFQLIDPPENPEEVVIVFEAVFQEDIIQIIESKGFSTLILAEGAKVAPYNPGTTLEDIDEEDARNEVLEAYNQIEATFALDHVVFCTTKEILEPLCKNY